MKTYTELKETINLIPKGYRKTIKPMPVYHDYSNLIHVPGVGRMTKDQVIKFYPEHAAKLNLIPSE